MQTATLKKISIGLNRLAIALALSFMLFVTMGGILAACLPSLSQAEPSLRPGLRVICFGLLFYLLVPPCRNNLRWMQTGVRQPKYTRRDLAAAAVILLLNLITWLI